VGLADAIADIATINTQLTANEGNISSNATEIGTNASEITDRLDKGAAAANAAQAVHGDVSWEGTQAFKTVSVTAESALAPVVQLLGLASDDTVLRST
jgi:hypothetical protein